MLTLECSLGMVVDHEIIRANQKSKLNVLRVIKPPEKVKKINQKHSQIWLKVYAIAVCTSFQAKSENGQYLPVHFVNEWKIPLGL